jgi:hypothetical protein
LREKVSYLIGTGSASDQPESRSLRAGRSLALAVLMAFGAHEIAM